MAPSNKNTYLQDHAVRERLVAHNKRLLKPQADPEAVYGETPEIFWVFNRRTEVDGIDAFLKGFQDIDFRDGNITVQDACVAVYGYADEYLEDRMSKMHLDPTSDFNKRQGGDMVVTTMSNGIIVRYNREDVGESILQTAADRMQVAVVKKINTTAKPVGVARRKALRIAGPGIEDRLDAITSQTAENIAAEQRRALGQ